MNVNSDGAGTWYYVVDCATCKAPIPFKQAPSPQGDQMLQLPTMRVRCCHCHNDHIYGPDLISRRQVSDAAR
jgi:hypothetical protein